MKISNFRDKTKDWHLHSYYSDGVISPEAQVKRLFNQGITDAVLTDHDGVDGLNEFADAAEKFGIATRTGIEMSSIILPYEWGVHILGYDFDPENEGIKEMCRLLKEKRNERNRLLKQCLENRGYSLSDADLTFREGQDFMGKPIFARALVNKGYCADFMEAFELVKSVEDEIKCPPKKIPADVVIKTIAAAGGWTSWAHPGLVKKIRHLRDTEEYMLAFSEKLDLLVSYGLGGIECDYPQHSRFETYRFAKLAEERGLNITRGSDNHGDEGHMGFEQQDFE